MLAGCWVQAVAKEPTVVSYYVDDAMQHYKGGIYRPVSCRKDAKRYHAGESLRCAVLCCAGGMTCACRLPWRQLLTDAAPSCVAAVLAVGYDVDRKYWKVGALHASLAGP